MKRQLFFVPLLFLLISTVPSCDKEEDNLEQNTFEAGDTEFTLSSGLLENYGKDEVPSLWDHDGYNIDLFLITESLTIVNDNGDALLNGTGSVVYFEMFSAIASGLEAGEYVFDDTSPFPVGTFDDGGYYIDWSTDAPNSGWIDITEGTVNVTKDGETYEIRMNGKDEMGNEVRGHYLGTLEYFNNVADE